MKNQSDDTGNPDVMHGVTLKMMVTRLFEEYGWEELGQRITIKCFTSNPSIHSSLKFLRKTPWAREKVENLYMVLAWRNRNTWPDHDPSD